MSSFITSTLSVTFSANQNSWAEPATAAVNVRGFPGGDSVAISLGGQRETLRSFGIGLASIAVYRAFASQRGRQGTLTVDGWDTDGPVAAVLKQVSPSPPGSDGTVMAVAQFVLV